MLAVGYLSHGQRLTSLSQFLINRFAMLICMERKQHVIIILGLGDQKSRQKSWKLIAKLWELFGVKVHIFRPIWSDKEDFKPKLDRLTDKINHLTNQGYLISLVGISAGASAALNAYMINKAKVTTVVFISGKLQYPGGVNPRFFKVNPAFKTSLHLSDINITKLSASDKQKMLYTHGITDRLISPKKNKPSGISNKVVPAFGHIPSIFVAITLYSRFITTFLKQ